ncbi:MAG TPA: sigma-54 dependent transcriptional regulator [Acidobacteriota bacterium]|nr:sigma-54 dependent transcriptional regulator [Acidobacteriota bacterium]
MKAPERTPRVLVVDDDSSFRCLVTHELTHTFPQVTPAESAAMALQLCDETNFDVVLLDIRMPDKTGLEVLKELKAKSFEGEVVMLTGHATIDTAIESLKMGAYDYLSKPCKLAELESIIQKAFEKCLLRRQNWTLRKVLDRQSGSTRFIGESQALRQVLDIVGKVASTDTTVLIQGESGVGKELVAQAIHKSSARSSEQFVVVDCTSLQEELLQSELFGHERGAFTGAVTFKHGLFEVADGGTLFLDEVGELSPALQAKLLRVLETGTFRRLGGLRDIHVNVRIIAATNRVLEQMVRDGRLRDDLYYRINVVTIRVPPLRERREDILPLVQHFIGRMPGKRCVKVSEDALEILHQYSWPGNIRELQNVIERALILAEGDVIQSRELPGNMKSEQGAPLYQLEQGFPSLRDLEYMYIKNLLKRFSGHRGRIAATLGISERSLYRKLREYGLDQASDLS